MTTTDELKLAEDLKWKRYYEYRCCFCKVKRKTRKIAVAKMRVCNKCAAERLLVAESVMQLGLFTV